MYKFKFFMIPGRETKKKRKAPYTFKKNEKKKRK